MYTLRNTMYHLVDTTPTQTTRVLLVCPQTPGSRQLPQTPLRTIIVMYIYIYIERERDRYR